MSLPSGRTAKSREKCLHTHAAFARDTSASTRSMPFFKLHTLNSAWSNWRPQASVTVVIVVVLVVSMENTFRVDLMTLVTLGSSRTTVVVVLRVRVLHRVTVRVLEAVVDVLIVKVDCRGQESE